MIRVNVLLFAEKDNTECERFQKAIQSIVGPRGLERCRSITGLVERFRAPIHCLDAVILLVADSVLFAQLLEMADVLAEARLILMFSGEEDQLVGQALTLYPSFIGNVDRDWLDVVEILKKIKNGKKPSCH